MGFQTHLLLNGAPFSSNQRDENQLKVPNTYSKSYYYYFAIRGIFQVQKLLVTKEMQ